MELDDKGNQAVSDVATQNIFTDEPSYLSFSGKIGLLREASITGFSPGYKNLYNKHTKKAAIWNDALEGEREDIPKRQLWTMTNLPTICSTRRASSFSKPTMPR